MPTCYTCGDHFEDWRLLAEHVVGEHPDSKGANWAREFLRKNAVGPKARERARQEQARREREAEEARRKAEEVRSRWRSASGAFNDGFWEDFHKTFTKVEQKNESLQEQAISIVQKLYEYNMTDGEIQTIVNLAKKRAKK